MTVGYRNGQAYAEQAALGVGGHVVGSFERVVVVRLVFFHKMVHNLFHIATDVRVGIFVDGKGARRVFHKQVQKSRLRQFSRQMFHHLVGNQMTAAALFRQCEFNLLSHYYISFANRASRAFCGNGHGS